MDQERWANEQKAWERAGNKGRMPERLIQEHELPEIYQIEPDLGNNDEEVDEGPRKRKVIHYDDVGIVINS